ncbi:hypothetical protein PILCRDRAFT_820494 [Piloderma croceum F 1598]|uniref:Uncharacterized protein n=1 Tax=Piloderma croceum (strain F 1598) TaxID=765440 RepID=A0A0C3B8L7_PILCF|nr:hypothetical protein PILCRDRAFT_820494 [Piloderma croceum F 1598]
MRTRKGRRKRDVWRHNQGHWTRPLSSENKLIRHVWGLGKHLAIPASVYIVHGNLRRDQFSIRRITVAPTIVV